MGLADSKQGEGVGGNWDDYLLLSNSETGSNLWRGIRSQPTGCYLASQHVWIRPGDHSELARAWNRPCKLTLSMFLDWIQMSTDIPAHRLSVLCEGRRVEWIRMVRLSLHLPHGDQVNLLPRDDHLECFLCPSLIISLNLGSVMSLPNGFMSTGSRSDNTPPWCRGGFLSISCLWLSFNLAWELGGILGSLRFNFAGIPSGFLKFLIEVGSSYVVWSMAKAVM